MVLLLAIVYGGGKVITKCKSKQCQATQKNLNKWYIKIIKFRLAVLTFLSSTSGGINYWASGVMTSTINALPRLGGAHRLPFHKSMFCRRREKFSRHPPCLFTNPALFLINEAVMPDCQAFCFWLKG